MTQNEVYITILGFIGLSLPILTAFWRIFAIKESLQVAITANAHRINLLEQESKHLVDNQVMFLNGIQDRLQHVRDRSKHAEEDLDRRLEDLESYLEKSTAFTKRNRS